MPKYSDKTTRWEHLLATFASAPDLLPITEVERTELGNLLTQAKQLEAQQDALRAQSEDAIMDFGEALTSLDLRAEILDLHPGDPSRQIVSDAIDAYEAIEADLGPSCGGAAR